MTNPVSFNMMRIASCSYEGSIFGWNVVEDVNKEGLEVPMSFGFNCSQGALKTLAVSSGGLYLSCGGTDERIRIFNVAENRSMGELGLHEGAITSLEFFEDSHMISGSEDTMLRIWRCHDWECVHVLSGHKEAITSVSIHPSGKLALSVSKDNTMKLWNLVQGRCSFTRRLRGAADKVVWHPSGDYYMLTIQTEVQIYRACDNVCTAAIKHKTRVNKATFTRCRSGVDNNSVSEEENASIMRVACICEDKTLIVYDLEGKQLALLDVSGLDGRPRDMWSCKLAVESGGADDASKSTTAIALEEEGDCLVTVTSLGRISVISCRSIEAGNNLEECTLVSTQVKMEPRLTGVVAWSTASKRASSGSLGDAGEEAVAPRASNKRPRDSTSAAADIASHKAIETEIKAASEIKKLIALKEANRKAASNNDEKKGKKTGKDSSRKAGREKDSGKKDDKGKHSKRAPFTPAASGGMKSNSKDPSSSSKKSKSSASVETAEPKTKANVYYKKR